MSSGNTQHLFTEANGSSWFVPSTRRFTSLNWVEPSERGWPAWGSMDRKRVKLEQCHNHFNAVFATGHQCRNVVDEKTVLKGDPHLLTHAMATLCRKAVRHPRWLVYRVLMLKRSVLIIQRCFRHYYARRNLEYGESIYAWWTAQEEARRKQLDHQMQEHLDAGDIDEARVCMDASSKLYMPAEVKRFAICAIHRRYWNLYRQKLSAWDAANGEVHQRLLEKLRELRRVGSVSTPTYREAVRRETFTVLLRLSTLMSDRPDFKFGVHTVRLDELFAVAKEEQSKRSAGRVRRQLQELEE
eukprot:Hpha_TRINITY_DN23204_c0_g1::TRINITY_DN23204_c0_g1_i1::g.30228::m.30228